MPAALPAPAGPQALVGDRQIPFRSAMAEVPAKRGEAVIDDGRRPAPPGKSACQPIRRRRKAHLEDLNPARKKRTMPPWFMSQNGSTMKTTIGSRQWRHLAMIAMAQVILGVNYPGVPDH